MLKAKELVDKSIEELQAMFNETCQELFELINAYKLTKKHDQPHLLKEKRKDKARLLTIIKQKTVSTKER